MHPRHEVTCLRCCMESKKLTPQLERAAGELLQGEGFVGFMGDPFGDLLVTEGQSRWFT